MSDYIEEGIQATVSEGWCIAHYVTIAAFQRVNEDGVLESATVMYSAGGQAQYITDGLLMAAGRICECADEDADPL